MKKAYHFLAAILLLASSTVHAQVAINTDGTNPDNTAVLEVKSTNKGLLLPRMGFDERNAIPNPATGLLIYCTNCNELQMYDGTAWVRLSLGTASPPTVMNPTTGKTWMRLNLGASRVATSSTDALALGDLYQWGRAADGHEKRTSGTTATNATTAVPNQGNPWDGLFITEDSNPFDWLTPQNDNLWQGTTGTNNPCPSGFRLPTFAEWEAEFLSWSSFDAAGAFASSLKLPVTGNRSMFNGNIEEGLIGYYWSSSISSTATRHLYLSDSTVFGPSTGRAFGCAVRCIKD